MLIDALVPDELMDRLDELGPPREALLTNRHHWRDGTKLAARLGSPCERPGWGCTSSGARIPWSRTTSGTSWRGARSWPTRWTRSPPLPFPLPPARTRAPCTSPACPLSAVADGVTNHDGLGFVPDSLMDDPEDTKAGLRDAYARLADTLEFENLLTAHGDPVIGGARRALAQFAAA